MATLIRAGTSCAALVIAVACTSDATQSDYRVRGRIPHDAAAFTQGLLFHGGRIYESTGQYGSSEVRIIDASTGVVVQSRRLAADRFGEGLTRMGDRLYQLTWKSGVGYVYALESLAVIDSFGYAGEGWGLASDGESLIMSDGTSVLRFLDTLTYEVRRELEVTDGGAPLSQVNELEFVDGQLLANVYQSDWIVRIDLETGAVIERYSLRGLLAPRERTARTDVLNGIAYGRDDRRLFVTGKYWPYLFHVQFVSGDSLFPAAQE